MSVLLIDEPPLQVLPSLAVAIGLNEALILQQIHYWVGQKKRAPENYKSSFKHGEFWVYNSVPQWNVQFPFWGDNTIRRALTSLREQGLLVAAQLADDKHDKTLWYRIDYAKLEALTSIRHEPRGSSKKKWINASTQNGQMGEVTENSNESSVGFPSTQNEQMVYPEWADASTDSGQSQIPKMGESLTETSSETSTEISTENLPPPQVPPTSTSGEEDDDNSSCASGGEDKSVSDKIQMLDDQQKRVDDMLEKISKITGTSIDLGMLRPLVVQCVRLEHKDAWIHTLNAMKNKMAETKKPTRPNHYAATVLSNALQSPAPTKPKPKAAPEHATPPVATETPGDAPEPLVEANDSSIEANDAPAEWAYQKARRELSGKGAAAFNAKNGRISAEDDWRARAREIEAAGKNSS